ncbi:MAG TPA: FAD-dependent oxidoreductase, partial [Chitinophagales bacterium]|nr:FAD-dependent oxidoreductase [Chitinophagales bacterium]
RGLVEAAVRRGVRVYTQTHANEIDREDGLVEVETSAGGKVICNDVVVATNSPVSDLALVHIKQSAYRTFVVAGPVPKGSVPLALYWDNDEPYHYVRLQPEADHDVLIIGGEDHKTGQEDDANERYTRLENWARLRFPMLGEIKYRWSGQVVEPIDGLGYIGHEPEGKKNQYIITGDSGMGMTHATLGATIVRDLILGRENLWANVYRAGRLNLKAGGEMLREDLNMAAQYVDHVTGGDVKSVKDIPVGEGRVIRKGLKKYAVYKDAKGTMHTMSAVCTHLGCIVQWNTEEKTWDCPCHGSRFDAYGTVVNGPAIERLKEEDDLDD